MSALPEKRQFTVEVPPSTSRWLRALARANRVRAEDLLVRTAICIAAAAGQSPGSPEAEVGRRLLWLSGYHAEIEADELDHLRRLDAEEGAPA